MCPAVPARKTARPRLVLLVDRDDDTREMYAEYLAAAAVLIEQAADGRDALARAIAQPPDLIVTETRLPGLDGYQLCALLRADVKTRTIPIVVVTGDGYDVDVERARHVGADVVLVKPCLPEVLLAEMRRLAARTPNAHLPEARGTTSPAVAPVLLCPGCHQFLIYERSHARRGGDHSHYYRCAGGCGEFQYQQRTKKLRLV
jgi:DNA-binding response OmpR family regulator